MGHDLLSQMGFACIFEALVLREYLELELLPGFVEKLSVSTFISATFFWVRVQQTANF